MEFLLFAREVGGFQGDKHAQAASLKRSIDSSEVLVRRLTNHRQLSVGGGSAGALCCSWDDAGVQLAVGTDTCQLLIYNADKGRCTHTFDPGHVEGIACAEFLPGTNSRLLVTAGPAKDIRVVDIERQAVRVHNSHAATIKSILPLSTAVFASGGEDGTIRCHDSRVRGNVDDGNQASRSVLVDQRHEAAGHLRGKASVQSMSQDPLNTQYIATGGGDALVRVYDVRMMRQPSSAQLSYSRSRPPPWCYCLAPSHMRDDYQAVRLHSTSSSVSSVAYHHTGRRLLACYTGKDTYSFDVAQHSCSYDQLMDSRQQHLFGRRQLQQQPPWLQEGVRQRQGRAAALGSGRRALRGRRMMAGVWPADNGGAPHSAGQHQAAAAQQGDGSAATAGTATAGLAAGGVGAAGPAAGAARTPLATRTVRSVRSAQTRQRTAAAGAAAAGVAAADPAAGSAGGSAAGSAVLHGSERLAQLSERLIQLQQNVEDIQQQLRLSTEDAPAVSEAGGVAGHSSSSGDDRSQGPAGFAAGSDASISGSGTDGGSAGEDSDGDEFTLTAEVQLLGPDGTVLHTSRVALHRDDFMSAGADDDEDMAEPNGDAQQEQLRQQLQQGQAAPESAHPQHSLPATGQQQQVHIQQLQQQLLQAAAAGSPQGLLGQSTPAPSTSSGAAAGDNAAGSATANHNRMAPAAECQQLPEMPLSQQQQQQHILPEQGSTAAATATAAAPAAAAEGCRTARRISRRATAAASAAASLVAVGERQEGEQQQRQGDARASTPPPYAAGGAGGVATAASPHASGTEAAAAAPALSSRRQRSSRSLGEAAAAAGSRAGAGRRRSRARRLNGNAFMALGGEGAGTSQSIADMSPSVAERPEWFLRSQAAATRPGAGFSALSGSPQHQQEEQQQPVVSAAEPACKRARREAERAAGPATGAAGAAAATAAGHDRCDNPAAVSTTADLAAAGCAPEQLLRMLSAPGAGQLSRGPETGPQIIAGAGADSAVGQGSPGPPSQTRRRTSRRHHPCAERRSTTGQQQAQQHSRAASAQQGPEAAGGAAAAAAAAAQPGAAAPAAPAAVSSAPPGDMAAAAQAHNATHAALQRALGAAVRGVVTQGRSAMLLPAGPDGPLVSVHQFAIPLNDFLAGRGGATGRRGSAVVAPAPAQQQQQQRTAVGAAAAGQPGDAAEIQRLQQLRQLRQQRLHEVMQRSMQLEAARVAQRAAAAAAAGDEGGQLAATRVLRPASRPPASPAAAGAQRQQQQQQQQQRGSPLPGQLVGMAGGPIVQGGASNAAGVMQCAAGGGAAGGQGMPALAEATAALPQQQQQQDLQLQGTLQRLQQRTLREYQRVRRVAATLQTLSQQQQLEEAGVEQLPLEQQRPDGLVCATESVHTRLGAMRATARAAAAATAGPMPQGTVGGSRHGGGLAADAAAAPPTAAGTWAGASRGSLLGGQQQQEDAGAAAMLRAELRLPQLCRQDVERRLLLRRQHRQSEQQQPAAARGYGSAADSAVAAASLAHAVHGRTASSQQATFEAEAAAVTVAGDGTLPGQAVASSKTGEAAAQRHQTRQQQPEARRLVAQQVKQETEEQVQHRLRRGKRKRRSSGHVEQAKAAAIEAAGPLAGSDAAYVAALSGVAAGGGSAAAVDPNGVSAAVSGMPSSRRNSARTQAATAADADAAPARRRAGRQARASAAAAAPSPGGGSSDSNGQNSADDAGSDLAAAAPLLAGSGGWAGDGRDDDGADSDGSPPQLLDLAQDFETPGGGLGLYLEPAGGPDPAAAAAAAAGELAGRVGAAGSCAPDTGGVAEDGEEHAAAAAARGYSRCFSGRRSTTSGRNAAWMGSRGQYVVSGADDGCLFVWAAGSGELVTVLRGGDKAVRRVQVNPHQMLLASCGAEPTVRLWSPLADAAAAGTATAAVAAAAVDAATEEEQLEVGRRAAVGGLMGMLRQIGGQLVWGLMRGHDEGAETDGGDEGEHDGADGEGLGSGRAPPLATAAADSAEGGGSRGRRGSRNRRIHQRQQADEAVGSGGGRRSGRAAAGMRLLAQQQQQQQDAMPGAAQQVGDVPAGTQGQPMPRLPRSSESAVPGDVQPVVGQPVTMIALRGGQVLFPGPHVLHAAQQQQQQQQQEQQQQRDGQEGH